MLQDKGALVAGGGLTICKIPYPRVIQNIHPSFTFSHARAPPPPKTPCSEELLFRKKGEKDGFALLRLLTGRIGWPRSAR